MCTWDSFSKQPAWLDEEARHCMRAVCAICSCSSTTCLLLMQYSCTAYLLPMHWRMVKAWLVMNERTNERMNERMHEWQSGRT